jgi:hypothetical protein
MVRRFFRSGFLFVFLAAAAFAAVWAEAGLPGRLPTDAHRALEEGRWVVAETPFGFLKIQALSPSRRVYVWGDCAFREDLERQRPLWRGSLGTVRAPALRWSSCDGVRSVASEEGRLDFPDDATARKWLEARLGWARGTFDEGGAAFGPEGYALFWGKVRTEERLVVDVWRVTVRGAPFEGEGPGGAGRLFSIA